MIWDTAGQEEFCKLRSLSFHDAKPVDILLVCFAIDNPDSLENIEDMWLPEVRTKNRKCRLESHAYR